MRYVRDVDAADEAAISAETAHVIAHLSAVADADDDPATHAHDVRAWLSRHPEDPALVRIIGELAADPDAAYFRAGHDPLAGVDPALYAAEVAAAARDEEVLRGPA
jgi:hypothetical protein